MLQLFNNSHRIVDADSPVSLNVMQAFCFLKFSNHPLLAWKLLFSSPTNSAQLLHNYMVFSLTTAPLTTLCAAPSNNTHKALSIFSRKGS
jgi:hypothetical protein